jgi:PAS domain S-box-containing protein
MDPFSERTDSNEKILLAGVSNFHSQILAAVNQSVIATDLAGIVVYWNRFAERLYGWKAEEATGQSILELTTPELATERASEIMAQLLQGKDWEGEFTVKRKDGTQFLARVANSPIYDNREKLIGIVGFSTDITEQKQAQASLRKSEDSMRLLIESASDYAIFTITADGLINSWNTGAERIFGYAEAEIVGRSGAILYTPEDRAKNIQDQEMRTALEKGRAEDERWHLRKDGTRFYASGVMQPLQEGTVNGFVKISRDMTVKIRADQTQRDKEILQKLVGALENERKIIARDLHDELGQELTALRLKLDFTRKNCNDTELCDRIDELQKIAKRLDERIDFISWELRPAALDDLGLLPAIEKYVGEWSNHTEISARFLTSSLKNIRFLPEVETNLYRIVQEALNNISKHAAATQVEVTLKKRRNALILIIEDNGKGFQPEDRPNPDKGIGLLGMQERIGLLGGTFEIESTPGKGTGLYFRVPASFIEEADRAAE